MFEWHKLWRGINSINWIFDTQSMTFVKLLRSNDYKTKVNNNFLFDF